MTLISNKITIGRVNLRLTLSIFPTAIHLLISASVGFSVLFCFLVVVCLHGTTAGCCCYCYGCCKTSLCRPGRTDVHANVFCRLEQPSRLNREVPKNILQVAYCYNLVLHRGFRAVVGVIHVQTTQK